MQSPGGDGIKTVATNRVSRYTRNIREMNQSVENLGEYKCEKFYFNKKKKTKKNLNEFSVRACYFSISLTFFFFNLKRFEFFYPKKI